MGATTEVEMRAKAKSFYHQHYEHVRKITPKANLLEYELGSGWEPLCTFLGKPIPDVPFPRVNESKAMEEKIAGVVAQGQRSIGKHAAMYIVPLLVVVGSLWWSRN